MIIRKVTVSQIQVENSPSGIGVRCNVACTDSPEWWKLDYQLDVDGECDELYIRLASSYAPEYIHRQGSFQAALTAFLEERALEIDWALTPHRKLTLGEQLTNATRTFKMFVGVLDTEPAAIYIVPEAIAAVIRS
jgi:hypothetical protein